MANTFNRLLVSILLNRFGRKLRTKLKKGFNYKFVNIGFNGFLWCWILQFLSDIFSGVSIQNLLGPDYGQAFTQSLKLCTSLIHHTICKGHFM
jgi:hypothetical protein